MIDELRNLVVKLEMEHAKFLGGNKAAGTRARILCMDVKKAAHELRQELLKKKEGK